MSRKPALCLLLLILPACMAHAGPWPRAEGEVFLSLSAERDRDGNSYTGLYGEYGLRSRQTLGFELGHSNAGESSVMIWWQRALDDGDGPNRFAISSGIGVLERDDKLVALAQVGASWGRGFDSLPWLGDVPGGGWLAVDARIKLANSDEEEPDRTPDENGRWSSRKVYLTPKTTVKTDVTLGWNASSSMMLINQLRLEDRDDTGFSAKLASSVVRDIGPVKMELGVVMKLSGEGEHAVKIGTWFKF